MAQLEDSFNFENDNESRVSPNASMIQKNSQIEEEDDHNMFFTHKRTDEDKHVNFDTRIGGNHLQI